MATSRQEKTYNEIIEYYNFADKLILEAETATHNLADQQFDRIEKIVETLEKCADELTSKYIEYVKSDDPSQVSESVRLNFNQILAKVEQCKNEILMLYKNNQQ